MSKPERLLDPKEVLRVMDAAQVIHERQAALEEHEALDREATIREIQIMYEELGDLVDSRTIEKALDEYLGQRYAFRPARPGPRRQLALLYIRRGWVAKRVLAPAATVVAVAWGGFALAGVVRERALERDTERLWNEVAGLVAEVRALNASGVPADLPAADAETFENHLGMAESRLAEVAAVLEPVREEAARQRLTHARIGELRARVDPVARDLRFTRSDIVVAGEVVERHARLGTLEAEVAGLQAAVLAEAAEDVALQRAAELRRSADGQIASRDLDGLEATAESFRQLAGQISAEYRIVTVGGFWRQSNELEGVRNHYLRVQAIDAAGNRLPMSIRNEENGRTEEVTEWAERVPQEVFDRVVADKEDNGIIDDDDFGFKRRGFLSAERNYEDLGQITEW